MYPENWIRVIAGTFVMASLALGIFVNHNWFWFTAFLGANPFQSGFTKWCLMEKILVSFGIKAAPRPNSRWVKAFLEL